MISPFSLRLQLWLIQLKYRVKAIPCHGKGRFCPVCGSLSRKFRRFGVELRDDAQCAHCGALERHRLLWLYLTEKSDLFDGKPKKLLHVAPELCFEARLRDRLEEGYVTADLFNTRAMVKMDITDIRYPDGSFDVLFCSHVLEHVVDDRKALREFFRVLAAKGWAILLVPITTEKTFEDFSIIDPAERVRVFGQKDHLRRYGADYVERLREAGFQVTLVGVEDLACPEEAFRMGLSGCSDKLFICTKARY